MVKHFCSLLLSMVSGTSRLWFTVWERDVCLISWWRCCPAPEVTPITAHELRYAAASSLRFMTLNIPPMFPFRMLERPRSGWEWGRCRPAGQSLGQPDGGDLQQPSSPAPRIQPYPAHPLSGLAGGSGLVTGQKVAAHRVQRSESRPRTAPTHAVVRRKGTSSFKDMNGQLFDCASARTITYSKKTVDDTEWRTSDWRLNRSFFHLTTGGGLPLLCRAWWYVRGRKTNTQKWYQVNQWMQWGVLKLAKNKITCCASCSNKWHL